MANEEVLGPRKTMFVLVIVVGCFAVLWPRILSPLLLGNSRDQLKPNQFDREAAMKQERPPMRAGPHPALRERGRAIPPGVPPAPTRSPVPMPPHVRVRSSPLEVYFQLDIKPPPIPGMRPPLGSPGGPVTAPKSSMGFVMPIYTICIIVFFVYTLSKIIFKRTGTTPYESISPDPQFRRRVFRDDSRTSPDKLVVTAISGLVAEVQQQMEASYAQNQQRQDLQDNHARPYTNGTVLHNSGPVHIVASEYREKSKEKSPEPVKDEQTSEVRESPIEPKESSPVPTSEPVELTSDFHDPLLDVKKPVLEPKELTPETLETVPEMKEPSPEPTELLPQLKEPTPESIEPLTLPKEPTSEPIKPTPDPREPTPELKESTPEPKQPTPEPKQPITENKDATQEHKELASALEEDSILEPKEPTPKPKEPSPKPIEPVTEPKELAPELNELNTEHKESTSELNTQEHTEVIPETKELSPKLEEDTNNSEFLIQKVEPKMELEDTTDLAEKEANVDLIKLTENIELVDDHKDSLVKSTEEFLSEAKQIEVESTLPKQSTPELLEEALKEESSEQESESSEPEEKGSVKVIGMELTAHTADGESPALPPLPAPAPAPAPRPHEAEEIKSIYLEGDIPQQSRVLVAEFEDRADRPAPTKHSPMVVSGKMTLSLIQDAPRHTPDRDLESTLDDFTTASGVTQPVAEIEEELSDEEIEEEIEVEEIEEEVEVSEEEIEEEIEEVPDKSKPDQK